MRQRLRFGGESFEIETTRRDTGVFGVRVNERDLLVEVARLDEHTLHLNVEGRAMAARVARLGTDVQVILRGRAYRFSPESGGSGTTAVLASPQIVAPMPGKVLEVSVSEGQEVAAGDSLLILEAMKMENRMLAEAAGTIRRVLVEKGQMVEGGQVLVELEYPD